MPTELAIEAEPGAFTVVKEQPDLFQMHFEALFRYFTRRTTNVEDAQDLTAETFVAAMQRRPPRGVEARCWLYGIGRRKLADYHRAQRKKTRDLDPELSAPHRIAEEAELRALIDALPSDQREALLLQALEQLTVEQISQVMGRSNASVKALLQRAKDRVRREHDAQPEVNS